MKEKQGSRRECYICWPFSVLYLYSREQRAKWACLHAHLTCALVGKSKLLDFPEREKEIAAATNHSDGLPFVYRVSNASPIRRSAWSTINSGMFSTSSSSFKLSSENRTRSLT